MISKRIKYSKSEVARNVFFQMPKFLLYSPEFKGISSEAIILYTLLKDRNELSIKNGWCDENDNVYQIFTRREMAKILNRSIKTVIKAMNALKKFKLIEEQRMGQGIPNRIYLLTLESLSETKKCTFYNSRSVKNTTPEVQNLQPNNKDLRKTEIEKEEREKKEKEKKEKDKGQKNFSRGINPEEKKSDNTDYITETNYITESEKKSIDSSVIVEKNLLVEKEEVEEPTKEPIKEEHIPIEKRKEKTEEHKTFKKIVNKKTEELEPTEEETKQSKAIINELNNCIKQYTNENNAQDINMTPKFLNAIVYWLRKGFQLNDFFKIIKLKVRTWIGTDLATQIKPSVLFSQHNFQEYLEETKLEKFTNPIYKRKPEQNPQPTRTNCQTEGNKEDDDKIMRLAIEKHKKEIAERVKNVKPTPEQIEWCKKNFGGLLSGIGYSV